MKSYYCKRLYEEINFDAENVYVCCGMSLGPCIETPNNTSKTMKQYLDNLIKWKYSVAKNAYIGNVSEQCLNCIELQEKEISYFEFLKTKLLGGYNSERFKIKNIIVKSFRQCELACVYCLERRYTHGNKVKEIVKSDFYNFLPILNSLIEQDLLDKNDLRIEFQGGSISVWDEFSPVLNRIKEYGISEVMYHTNAITFIPEISALAATVKSSMSIALDSGSAETYKRIKSENLFEQAVENIIKYANAGILISCKYIIVKNVNDNSDDINKFLNTIKEIRNKIINKHNVNVMIDIDFRDSLSSKDYIIPEQYMELISNAINFCKQENIEIGFQDFIKNKLKGKTLL